jgi:hypothetical protein
MRNCPPASILCHGPVGTKVPILGTIGPSVDLAGGQEARSDLDSRSRAQVPPPLVDRTAWGSTFRSCAIVAYGLVSEKEWEPGDAIVAGLPPAKERNGAQPARASSMADSTCFASPTTATLAVFMMGAFSSTLRATMNLAS